MANWIETKVRYAKTMENGLQKNVTEPYLVDALSFTEAEARIIKEITPYMQGEFTVSAVKRTNICEIMPSDDADADRWYKVKVAFIVINERTLAEKRSNSYYLVQAGSFPKALSAFENMMRGTMVDYEIMAISETPIMDVYNFKVAEK